MRFLIFFILFLGVKLSLSGQSEKALPLGSWRSHLPFTNAIGVERLGEKLFVACNSGIFTYDLTDGSIGVLTKVEGLSDVGITTIRKHPGRELLMIGYDNGKIDLIQDGKITFIKDIFISNVTESKRINSIQMSGNLAYISTDFGIIILNISKREVFESNLNVGANGNRIKVKDCVQFKDTVYAVTEQGFMSISIRDQFRNTKRWRIYPNCCNLPSDPANLFKVDSVNNQVILLSGSGLHLSSNRFNVKVITPLLKRNLKYFNGRYIVCGVNNILEIDTATMEVIGTFDSKYYQKISEPTSTYYIDTLKFITDSRNGFLRASGTDTTRILPNTPMHSSFALSSHKDEVVLLPGGYTSNAGAGIPNSFRGFSIFSNNSWKTYNPYFPENPLITSNPFTRSPDQYCRSFFNTLDQKLYLSTFGYGIVVKDGEKFSILNDLTTSGGLCNFGFQDLDCQYNDSEFKLAYEYIKIGGSTIDKLGNLWASNFEIANVPIRVLPAGEDSKIGANWKKLPLPGNGYEQFPLDIVADQNNYKWVRMAPDRTGNASIWIFNSDGTKKIALNTGEKSGKLPGKNVYDIQEDKSGYIWVGTDKGLVVFYNPINAFAPGGISASQPIFPPEAGRPVLENDVVTTIEVDGANRKWVGTKDNGIWLFNPDITKLISHFTTKNSPLVSDNIFDLVINKPTGELFIATDKGCVSYQTDANEKLDSEGNLVGAECANQDIVVFPNPVRKGYEGNIAVSGLASNSLVKFVTASGKLVYETTAKGGLATWNGFTYDGRRANPGIYLIMAFTEDGTTNCFSKLALLD
jgi:hypothetical protein